MARLLRHRQTKGAATDRPILPPPRHIPTLPRLCKNSGAETRRAIIESGRQRGRTIIGAEANFMTQYFVSVSKN